MTLTQLYSHIQENYTQTTIIGHKRGSNTLETCSSAQPRYFYRGENDLYPSTLCGFRRLKSASSVFFPPLAHFVISKHLYDFLKEAIWGIPFCSDDEHGIPDVELYIAGILQHYGFKSSFIDVTSDLSVAAHFAVENNTAGKGRILIMETAKWNIDEKYCFFDLTKCPGSRPQLQHSFVLFDDDMYDLKDPQFVGRFNGQWLEFDLTEQDRKNFLKRQLLSTTNDEVYAHIKDWWENSSIQNDLVTNKFSSHIAENIALLFS